MIQRSPYQHGGYAQNDGLLFGRYDAMPCVPTRRRGHGETRPRLQPAEATARSLHQARRGKDAPAADGLAALGPGPMAAVRLRVGRPLLRA
jgi:hypothetical protein